ncbi:MAG: diguanylate cyclase [Pyrinomonadaceae bacterium]
MEAQSVVSRETGLAVLLVEGHQPPQLTETCNNSICAAFQSSERHAHRCDPYCGEAFNAARVAGEPIYYRCHAGLNCVALPVELEKERPLALIAGRAFFNSADYRELLERVRTGELADLFSPELMSNVIFATRQDVENLARRLNEVAAEVSARQIPDAPDAEGHKRAEVIAQSESVGDVIESAAASIAADESIAAPTLRETCRRVIDQLVASHDVRGAVIALRSHDKFVPGYAFGRIAERAEVLCEQLGMIVRGGASKRVYGHDSELINGLSAEQVETFPLTVAGELRGALLVCATQGARSDRAALAKFSGRIALPLEVARLREELERRSNASTHLQAFTRGLSLAGPDDPFAEILGHTAELLRSERGSLLILDEEANELRVMAATGPRAEIARQSHVRAGEGVSGVVLAEGKPLVVSSVRGSGYAPAPPERNYKSDSFISYPLFVSGRVTGVLNVTDKMGGGAYDDLDLNLLEQIAPQMALALDRAAWRQKATEFQLLSITDPLTGLVNRRYMEERLSEEIERSKRHRFQMSFLMLDIDNFKSYNDRHGHPAGDLALEMASQCLRSALRSEDVASRYGGEEFSVLLPQTSIAEARIIAERIRRRVQRTQFPYGQMQPLGAVTISIGICAFGPQLDTQELIIHAADQALYAAKSRGKNRVEIYQPTPPPGRPADNAD